MFEIESLLSFAGSNREPALRGIGIPEKIAEFWTLPFPRNKKRPLTDSMLRFCDF